MSQEGRVVNKLGFVEEGAGISTIGKRYPFG